MSEGIEEIGSQAFCACGALAEVNIPRSVTFIDELVFDSCEALREIKYDGTREEWENMPKSKDWKSYSHIKTINCSDGLIELSITPSLMPMAFEEGTLEEESLSP